MPGNTNVPEVPAPADALTMKCDEYSKLDEATQRAVIKAILEQDKSQQQPPESEMIAGIMATTMCSLLPSAVVKEVVLGGSPP
jgi:hypothetical protein